jgi:glyoxylase-like metal-dependent hydrolase (beta-lactamase superfamily II)
MSVFFRTTGTMGGPEFFVRPSSRSLRDLRVPVIVAVVERPDGLALIDTGWSRRTCAFPDDDPGVAQRLLLGLSVKPEDALASQLISLGYAPGDVRHVIATHLHSDHIGGAVDFDRATVHVHDRELAAAARGLRGGYDASVRSLPRVATYALDPVPMLGFPFSRDLFGDGSVLLLDGRGHTAGSVVVAVKLQDGWALHAGDAAQYVGEYRADDAAPPSLYARVMSWNLHEQRRTYGLLRGAEAALDARVVVSHDPDLLSALPTTKEAAWPCAWDKRKPPPKPKAKA